MWQDGRTCGSAKRCMQVYSIDTVVVDSIDEVLERGFIRRITLYVLVYCCHR